MTDDRLQTREQMVESHATPTERVRQWMDAYWTPLAKELNPELWTDLQAVLALAAPPTPRGEEVLSGLRNLRAQFERIAAHHPNEQPAYPNGVRPWGTGDLRHNIETLEAAIAALSTPRAETDDDALRDAIGHAQRCLATVGSTVFVNLRRDHVETLLAFAAATPAPVVGDGAKLTLLIAAISKEADTAADVIRLKRDSGKEGRFDVATAINRIAVWSKIALAAAPASVTPDAGEVEELKAANKALHRKATDRAYMLEATAQMLGPKGREVVRLWKDKGVQRIHTSWAADPYGLHGEYVALLHLQHEEAAKNAVPIENVDADLATAALTAASQAEKVEGA